MIELEDGWGGRIITTEVYFSTCSDVVVPFAALIDSIDVLDGAMITLAIYVVNIFHPGRIFRHTTRRERQVFGPSYITMSL